MMGLFKNGDRIVATTTITDYSGVVVPKGTVGTFDDYMPDPDGLGCVNFPGFKGDTDNGAVRTYDRELALVTTPAQLDPGKVKVGDTVTVTQRTATVTDEVTLVTQGPHWHFDLKVYPSTVILGVPGVDDGLWTLTDHQPAPKPEPEWRVGAMYRATVHDDRDVEVMFTRGPVNGGEEPDGYYPWYVPSQDDFYHEVTDVRPLVVLTEEESREWRQWKDS